jgi:hypothetical protein
VVDVAYSVERAVDLRLYASCGNGKKTCKPPLVTQALGD